MEPMYHIKTIHKGYVLIDAPEAGESRADYTLDPAASREGQSSRCIILRLFIKAMCS